MKFPQPWYRKSRRAWFVTLDGRQIKLGTTKEEALRRYHDLMARPRSRPVPSGSLLALIDTFLEWCHKHRAPDTYEWYRYRLERFAQRHHELKTADLRPFHVQEWLDSLQLSNGSKRNYCRAVKRCLRWATQQGYIDHNPIAHLPLPKAGKRETIISDAEFEEILGLVRDRSFRDLLIVTWETGCRPQESLRVEARHIDLANQRWVFPETESKTDIPRVVYLTDNALDITQRLMLLHPSGPLFRNSRGEPWTTDAVNCAFVRIQIRMGLRRLEQKVQPKDRRRRYLAVPEEEVEKLAKTLPAGKKTKAELMHEARRKLTYKLAREAAPKYSLYTLRHTWMNRLLTKGVDALTVAFLAGHTDPSTLAKVYAHLSQNPRYLLEQAKKATA